MEQNSNPKPKRTGTFSRVLNIVLLLALLAVAAFFHMNTILWIAENFFSLGITALIIVFQPELRRALEQLGEKNILTTIVPFDNSRKTDERITDRTISELIKACFEMGRVRTGALIVIEQSVSLQEYDRTGIGLDSAVSSHCGVRGDGRRVGGQERTADPESEPGSVKRAAQDAPGKIGREKTEKAQAVERTWRT